MISDAELLSWTKAEAEDTALLRALERAAIQTIQNRTGRYWGVEDEIVETRLWRGGPVELQVAPTDGTVEVEYWDGTAWAATDATTFHLDGRFLRATVATAFSYTATWGTSTRELRLTYTGGATEDEDDADVWDAPEDIKLAVRLLVGHFYLNRETVVVGTTASEVPFGVDALIRDHRRMSV